MPTRACLSERVSELVLARKAGGDRPDLIALHGYALARAGHTGAGARDHRRTASAVEAARSFRLSGRQSSTSAWETRIAPSNGFRRRSTLERGNCRCSRPIQCSTRSALIPDLLRCSTASVCPADGFEAQICREPLTNTDDAGTAAVFDQRASGLLPYAA